MSHIHRPISPVPELEKPRRRFRYQCAALHVGTYPNGAFDSEKFTITEDQLEKAAPTMIHRPLRLNHEGWLPFPECRCEYFGYGHGMLAGEITVNEEIDRKIQSGEILHVSCDFLNLTKEGGGLVFHGLSLLSKDTPPRDKQAIIIPSSRRELFGMENIDPFTPSSSGVKESDGLERAKALMYVAKQKFGLSDEDCYSMGGEAIAHLGHAAIHADQMEKTTDPTKRAYHQFQGTKHVALAAAYSMAKVDALAAQAEESAAMQKLESMGI